MIRGRFAAATLGAGFLLGGCAGGLSSVPYTIADAEPVPTACPTRICPRPTPTHGTFSPDPEPTATPTGGGGTTPRPTKTPRPGQPTPPSRPTTDAPLPPGAGAGAPSPPPGSPFAAFAFHEVSFEQAFPLDAPPPPPPIKQSMPTPLVSLAGVLAACVAASAGFASRRRGRMLVV